MNEEKNMRLSQVARKLNVGTETIASFLAQKGFTVDNKPNAKITIEQFNLLAAEFISAGVDKEEAAHITIGKTYPSLSASADKHTSIKSKEQAKKKDRKANKRSKQRTRTGNPTYSLRSFCSNFTWFKSSWKD